MMARRLAVVRGASSGDDADALARVARGDAGALGEVYDRHARTLLRFVARAAGPSDAEDVVQITFLRAAQAAGSYDGRSESARPWLFGIAVRVLQERRRSLARLGRALARLDVSRRAEHPSVERSDIQRALGQLSESKRMAIILAEVEGFTCQEIATVLDTSIAAVWSRLHDARKELRGFFAKERS